MAHLWRLAGAAFAVLIATLLGGVPTPAASAAVPLGGGAGIVVDGIYCTLTTIGHDNAGDLVGFTSAHCGGPGAQVVAEGTNDPVGTVVAAKGDIAGDELGYAVIKFDPASVTPLADFAGFAINGIGPDPERAQPACQNGGATGITCGTIGGWTVDPRVVNVDRLPFQPGDEGAPVTVDGLLVGMVRNGYMHRVFWAPSVVPAEEYPRIKMIYFNAILDDVNVAGGPGAGFVPVGA